MCPLALVGLCMVWYINLASFWRFPSKISTENVHVYLCSSNGKSWTHLCTSLFGTLLQLILKFGQVWLKVLTAAHIKKSLFIAGQLLFLTFDFGSKVSLLLFSRCKLLTMKQFKNDNICSRVLLSSNASLHLIYSFQAWNTVQYNNRATCLNPIKKNHHC